MSPLLVQVRDVLRSYRWRCRAEAELQSAIATALRVAGIGHWREVDLGNGDRIDFLVGDALGLEVKTRGGVAAIAHQLQRYAQHAEVGELALVTTRMQHEALSALTLNGKTVHAIVLRGGAL